MTAAATPLDVGRADARRRGTTRPATPDQEPVTTEPLEPSPPEMAKELIDQMIDVAQEDNSLATYIILLGHAPRSSLAHDDLAWLGGRKTYRRFKVAQSGEIPSDAILLSPTADNYQVGAVTDYKGVIGSADIVRRTLYA